MQRFRSDVLIRSVPIFTNEATAVAVLGPLYGSTVCPNPLPINKPNAQTTMNKRDGFASSFGVLVAMAGSAVGLGNLWRFPYLVGNNGGAAFIFLYIPIVFLLALPIMYAEFIIGRKAQTNVYGGFKKLAPNTQWPITGILAILCCLIVLAFYSVVGGWTINYLWKSLTFNLVTTDTSTLSTLFTDTVTSSWEPLISMLVFVGLSGIILLAGIKDGIEKYSKVLMPLLFIMVIVIAIRSMTLPNAQGGIDFLFKPDFTKINANTALEALGQAFLSLSIGFGIVFTYASYVKKEVSIIKMSAYTALSDTLFAIIAGLAIMPAVFSFGLTPGQGPGLVFVTLPYVFSNLFMGEILAILFFFVLFIAAITSSISLLEVIVAFLAEEFNIPRKTSIWATVGTVVILSTLCSLSQGVLSHIQIAGCNIFDLCDKFTANFLMPTGALLIVLYAGWVMKRSDFMDEITSSGRHHILPFYLKFVYFSIRYLAPIVIAIIMARGIWINVVQ